jgi:Family of unknown function (DUF6125)
MDWIEQLSREDLIRLVRVYARNWLAHDGCWFLAAEERYDIETAMQLDAKSWERFAVAEARRIMKEFEIPPNNGLAALERALQFRLYAAINCQQIETPNNNTMIFHMLECRVQQARQERGLPEFPCKSVGIVEFANFARTVDERICTRCITCPPDLVRNSYCSWEFTIGSGQGHFIYNKKKGDTRWQTSL